MKNLFLWQMVLPIIVLSSCSGNDEDRKDMSFIGKPMNINVNIADVTETPTRASTAMTSGTVWINGTDNSMKAYTWSGSNFTTEDPLLWTAETMNIYGYYADRGATTVTDSRSYTVSDASNASFLAGATTTTYNQETREEISLSLHQQLAYVYVTVSSDLGTTMTEAKLGNGMLYTSGVFDNNSFDLNGYANGGTDNSGWTTSGSPTTIDMIQSATSSTSTATSATYYAIIIPQTIGTTSPVFTVKISGYPVGFRLNASQTFKAGMSYNLLVDRVTYVLYMESIIMVSDFTDSGFNESQTDLEAN